MNEGKGWVWGVGIAIAVIAIGGWVYYAHQRAQQSATAGNAAAPTAAAAPIAPTHYPIEPAAAGTSTSAAAPLPAIGDDAAIIDALARLPGGAGLRALLRPRLVIQHIVATINALPDRSLGDGIMPVHRPKSAFEVSSADGATTIAFANATRYAPYMQVIEAVPTHALVAWYVRFYPLFQKAYRDLGYRNGYFNDRLIVVIDDLLATPDRATPPSLVPGPHGTWDYAEPSLQGLSIGQRMVLRAGASDEAAIKAKLRAIRAALTQRGMLH